MHIAAEKGFEDVVSVLVSIGASPDLSSKVGGEGCAPFPPPPQQLRQLPGGSPAGHLGRLRAAVCTSPTGHASRRPSPPTGNQGAALLTSFPLPPGAPAQYGLSTPLHLAAEKRLLGVCRLLLQAGAKAERAMSDGRSALALAEAPEQQQLKEVLMTTPSIRWRPRRSRFVISLFVCFLYSCTQQQRLRMRGGDRASGPPASWQQPGGLALAPGNDTGTGTGVGDDAPPATAGRGRCPPRPAPGSPRLARSTWSPGRCHTSSSSRSRGSRG
jgi:hypothetical protein